MTRALFLTPLAGVGVGDEIVLTGDEAHHAVAVRRIAIGERVLLSDGEGTAVGATVTSTAKRQLGVTVEEVETRDTAPLTWTVAQALAKGERSDIAVQTATELGARRILAWQAARSIVRWQGERAEKSLDKWRTTAREATKQARRYHLPGVGFVTTADVLREVASADIALVLHEEATSHIAEVRLPAAGEGLLIVGPEGGITGEELEGFVGAGALPVSISDGVLRTSTAAAVALGQLDVLARR